MNPRKYTSFSLGAGIDGPVTTIICASSLFNSRHARIASSMRNTPTFVPPGATRTVFLRNTKSSLSFSRVAENARTIGPTYVAFGRSIFFSSARTRTWSRSRRDRTQRRPYDSTRRVANPPPKDWPTEWATTMVGTLRFTARRTEAISPSEIRNRNRSQSASFLRNLETTRTYFPYARYQRNIEWSCPRSEEHTSEL